MANVAPVLADLEAESAELDAIVSELPSEEWGIVTTPEGWTIGHQIGHLHWTDRQSVLAIRDEAAFNAQMMEFAAKAARCRT